MNSNIIDLIKNQLDEIYSYAVTIRRDLHKHPETAWLEIRTSAIIERELREMGFDKIISGKDLIDEDSRMSLPSKDEFDEQLDFVSKNNSDLEKKNIKKFADGFTGIMAVLNCGVGPVTALRVDIDALPLKESESQYHFPNINCFNSEISGKMHACGHDMHTAIGLGIARILSENRTYLKGTIKIIFQPAEEGARGASSIIKKGHLDDVRYLLGLHVKNYDPDKEYQPDILIESNKTFATTKIDVRFIGKEAHAAISPESGNNALLCACNAVMNLYAISRHSSSDTRVNVGTLNAGQTRNLICSEASMKLEVRGSTTDGNSYMLQRAEEILRSSAQMYGCKCEISYAGYALCTPNDPDLSEFVSGIINTTGLSCEYHPEITWNASEDYSIMADHVQKNNGKSCYVKIMGKGKYPLHDNNFDIPEESIKNAILGLSYTIYTLCKK